MTTRSQVTGYTDAKGYTEYTIKTGGVQTSHRFSDFLALHAELDLPGKPTFSASKRATHGEAVKSDRQARFEEYLNALIAASEGKMPRPLSCFLGLERDQVMEQDVLDKDGVLWNTAAVGTNISRPAGSKASTCYELMQEAISRYGAKPAVGRRALLKRHYEALGGGREVEKLELGPSYEWLSYAEYGKAMGELGAGMVGFAGLKPQDRVVIYAETQREWMLAAQAAWTQSLQVVTVGRVLSPTGQPPTSWARF